MALPKDPVMLLSYVNTQLRDNYNSVEELCKSLNEDQEAMEQKLAGIDYHYSRERNQFV